MLCKRYIFKPNDLVQQIVSTSLTDVLNGPKNNLDTGNLIKNIKHFCSDLSTGY